MDEWNLDEDKNLILMDNLEIPFIGIWGGTPLLEREGVGELTLSNTSITLKRMDGSVSNWEVENFSGDWAQVTFDSTSDGILYGAPYDFDYQYISVT